VNRFLQDKEEEKETTANIVRSQGVTGKNFRDTVAEKFLSEYDGMKSLDVSEGYAFTKPPRIMQNMRRTESREIHISSFQYSS
jgi:hypothetical protein